jgi:hypothetical protein
MCVHCTLLDGGDYCACAVFSKNKTFFEPIELKSLSNAAISKLRNFIGRLQTDTPRDENGLPQ